jgi:large subunit ribosomal protein L10
MSRGNASFLFNKNHMASLLRQKKEEEVEKLSEKFSKIKSAVFLSYKGLKVAEAQKLRRALRAEKSEYKVAKKTLLDIAVKKAGLPESGIVNLEGQAGIAFDYESETGALKIVDGMIKGGLAALKIAGGIIEGKIFGAIEMKQLAALPGRQELRGQVVGLVASPLQGFVRVLNGNMVGLINVLKAQSEKKQ